MFKTVFLTKQNMKKKANKRTTKEKNKQKKKRKKRKKTHRHNLLGQCSLSPSTTIDFTKSCTKHISVIK